MRYVSPFHLLPKRDIFTLTAADVKRWKKELLLQFDLNQSSVINIDDKEYDKNTVLEAFDRLKEYPDYHIKLYHNKPLLKFIEEGDTGFFSGLKNYTHFQDKGFRDWIAPFFIPQYNEAVYQLIIGEGRESLYALDRVCKSKFPFPEEWEQGQAYEKMHRFLINFIEKADKALNENTVFVVREGFRRKLDFSPEISQYVDMNLAHKLNALPPHFDKIKYDYGVFNQDLVEQAFLHHKKIKTPTDNASGIINNANRIAKMMHNGSIELDVKPHEVIADVTFGFIDSWIYTVVMVLVIFFMVIPIIGYLLLQLLSYLLG